MVTVSKLVAQWVAQVVRAPLLVVLLFLALTAGLAWFAANNLGINTSTADMVAEHLPWRKDFIAYRESFPDYQNTLVAVIDSDTPELAREVMNQLELLADESGLFEQVFSPTGNEFFDQNGFLFLSTEELTQLSDQLAKVQPILAKLVQGQRLKDLFELLSLSLEQGREQQVADFAEELSVVFQAASQQTPGVLSWSSLTGANEQTLGNTRQFLILKPKLDFSKLQPAKQAIETLKSLPPVPGVSVRITGSVALEFEELQSVTQGVKLAGSMAAFLVAVFLFLALRSGVLIFAALFTLVSGLIGTAAFAAGVFGSLNLISVAFAVLYIGLGIDFAIHFCLRFRELLVEGSEKSEALITTGGDVGASLVFCAVTTAAGFFSFFPTEFSGVSELGLISGVGMFVSLLVTLTLLPALLMVLPINGKRLTPLRGIRRFVGVHNRFKRPVILGTLAISLLAALAIPAVEFDSNPLNLRDPESQSVSTFTDLLEDSESSPLTLISLMDREDIESMSAALTSKEKVSQTVSLLSFVPSDQYDKLFLLEDLSLVLGPKPESAFADETNSEVISALDSLLADLVGKNDPSLVSFREQLQDWHSFQAGDQQDTKIADLRNRIFMTLPFNVERLWLGIGSNGVGENDLPPDLVRRWRTDDGVYRLEVFPDGNMLDPDFSRGFIETVRDVVPNATGIPVVNQEAGDVIARSFRLAFVYAAVVVFFLLFVWLRSLTDALTVIIPIILAGLMTMAAMVLLGLPLNYANIIALPLLLGIGVDNGIHMMHRYVGGTRQLLSTSTARAVFFSTLTTVASFGNLAFSPHLGTASMGALLTLGMTCILFMTLVFLPAVLERNET